MNEHHGGRIAAAALTAALGLLLAGCGGAAHRGAAAPPARHPASPSATASQALHFSVTGKGGTAKIVYGTADGTRYSTGTVKLPWSAVLHQPVPPKGERRFFMQATLLKGGAGHDMQVGVGKETPTGARLTPGGTSALTGDQ